MAKRFTGKNRQVSKFLGVAPEEFQDPGFCLGCGEEECECDLDERDRCQTCYEPHTKCTCTRTASAPN